MNNIKKYIKYTKKIIFIIFPQFKDISGEVAGKTAYFLKKVRRLYY
jgi:hypothetical protein